MKASDWNRLEGVLDAALDRPVEERAAFVAEECGDDAALLAEVQRLLRAVEPAAGFLERSLGDYTPDAIDGCLEEGHDGPSPLPVERIGPYRLIREIGRGGMGAVYLAERSDGQFDKKVAIKLVPRGPDAAGLGRRFAAEQRILASLEHPHIATLLDGGMTADGLPYLVMEYVEGQRIDRWCDERRLGIRERLRLCDDVAAAVQFAHQHLVVHRDLKPGNILVTADGQVKLLDFGIAKLISEDVDAADEPLTATGSILATPEYASPEQIRGERVTTAADVYALGVLLYELLTGRRPHTASGRSREELVRAICEQTPARPSEVVGRKDPRSRALAGDLDTIVLTALRQETALRYASVQALRDDLRRHLDGFPVLARPASRRYRLGKFVQRNRGLVAATALVTLAVLGGLAATSWQARVASRHAERTERVRAFLTGIFAISDPDTARGRAVTARELLDRGAASLRSGLERDPEIRGEMLGVVGSLYQKLGLYPDARPLLEQALEVQRSRGPSARHAHAAATNALSTLLYAQGEYEEAERLAREALAGRRDLPLEDSALAGSIANLAAIVRERGRLEEADSLNRVALRLDRLRNDTAAIATTLTNLSAVLWRRGQHTEAQAAAEEAVALRRALHGNEHTETAGALRALALVFTQQGRYGDAQRLFEESLAINRRLLGEGHPRVASTLGDLGLAYWRDGKLDEAEQSHRRALAINRAALGERHPDVGANLNNIATALYSGGRYTEAAALIRDALAIWRETLGELHPNVLSGLNNLGAVLRDAGDLDAAEPVLREVLTLRRRKLGDEHQDVAQSLNNLAFLLLAQGKPVPAESLFHQSTARWTRTLGPDHPNVAQALAGLGQALLEQGRPREALASLQRSLDIKLAKFDTAGTEVAVGRRDLGICLARLGRYEEAERLLAASYPVLLARFGEEHRSPKKALAGMEELERLRSRPAGAATR